MPAAHGSSLQIVALWIILQSWPSLKSCCIFVERINVHKEMNQILILLQAKTVAFVLYLKISAIRLQKQHEKHDYNFFFKR